MNRSKTQSSNTVTVKLDMVDAKTMREVTELLGQSREQIAQEVLGLWLQEQRAAIPQGEGWITDTLRKGWGVILHPFT